MRLVAGGEDLLGALEGLLWGLTIRIGIWAATRLHTALRVLWSHTRALPDDGSGFRA